MGRPEKLRLISVALKQAAAQAHDLAGNGHNGASRVSALATQIEGVAIEFEILANNDSDPAISSLV